MLAACAGATDALAFFGLGKAFAGIVTGNLVTVGYGIATRNSSLVKPTVTAVAGSVVGEITWAWLLRRPGAGNGLLITELTLFLLVLAGWLAAGSHPAGISALALLALVSVAIGGQSIWAQIFPNGRWCLLPDMLFQSGAWPRRLLAHIARTCDAGSPSQVPLWR